MLLMFMKMIKSSKILNFKLEMVTSITIFITGELRTLSPMKLAWYLFEQFYIYK